MAAVISREAYFEAGLDVLSDLGYGGLKLAEVCRRLGVTTGSFYHYFASWSEYTGGLIKHWQESLTLRIVQEASVEPDPRRRLDTLFQSGLTLPHGAEAAIRSWSSTDPVVREVQAEVDQQRFDSIYAPAVELLGDARQAHVFAAWGMYVLVGYEQCALPRDDDALAWISGELLQTLDSGRFAGATHPS